MPNGQQISPILTDAASVQELNPDGGGVTNQLPTLKQTGEVVRQQSLTFNTYTDTNGNRYSATHPNAQSDGDEYGRGDVSNSVGTKTDKIVKNSLLYSSGNKYNPVGGYYNFDFGEQYW